MQNLKCVAYVSSANELLSVHQLESLLDDARRFNQTAGVTGVLLYSDGSFFQYFEGPASSVTKVYERIRNSSTHHAIYELLNAEIEHREFPDWLMGLSLAPTSTVLSLHNAQWTRMASSIEHEQGEQNLGLALLRSYWKQNSMRGQVDR